MEESNKLPSLPPNYVSLVQLKERWLEEQERKKKEKEAEEERKKEREKQDQERLRGNRAKQKQSENREKGESSSGTVDHRRFRRNRQNQCEYNRSARVVGEPKPDEVVFVAVVGIGESIGDKGQTVAESKKKRKKKKKNWRNGKPRVQENLTEGTSQLPQDKEPGGEFPVVVTETNGKKEEVRRDTRGNGKSIALNRKSWGSEQEEDENEGNRREFRRNGRTQASNGQVWEERYPVDGSEDMKLRFENLTINGGGKMGNSAINRYRMRSNGGSREYRSGFKGYNSATQGKLRDPNKVWVKKGDISDADATGIQNSGSLKKAEGADDTVEAKG